VHLSRRAANWLSVALASILSVLLLWLGGGLGLRSSVVLSLILVFFFYQTRLTERHAWGPKRGVLQFILKAKLGSMLLDLGIIDQSTNADEIIALQKLPGAAYPLFEARCVWIPEANLYVWPSLQIYQSIPQLNLPIRLPLGCCLGESIHKNHHGFWSEEEDREVEFFIEYGYPESKFGLRIPIAFAEERIKAGGFGSACVDMKERLGRFELTVGHLPTNLFRPYVPDYAIRDYVKHGDALREFDKGLDEHFEQLGWEIRPNTRIAIHKYMVISIDNSER
jgi:hypothetical protein